MAVACYARAMDHVGTLALDPAFRWLDRVILDLHFDACYFQRDKGPGLWRTGPIGVTASDGSLEFQGPDADAVPGLMAEVVEWLAGRDLDANAVVRAAMAHLHVTSIHPFRDGNGRVSRIVQSLVLAREGLMSPEFSSIEEYLGENTPAYYAALREVQDGGYRPERDATSWIEFCVEAHIAQAQRRLTQVKEAAARWDRLEALVDDRGWPDRLVIALEQSLIGGTDRGRFGEEAGSRWQPQVPTFDACSTPGWSSREAREGAPATTRASGCGRSSLADAAVDQVEVELPVRRAILDLFPGALDRVRRRG